MVEGNWRKFEIQQKLKAFDCPTERTYLAGEAYERQVRAWTEKLSNQPGWQGKLVRRALMHGWC